MLINLSNHPSSKWSEEQLQVAQENFGDVLDLQFPNVPPNSDETFIDSMANDLVVSAFNIASNTDNFVVHIMGEMTLTFAVVRKFLERNIRCVASTTERVVVEKEAGHKEIFFKFVKFRFYGN